MTSAAKRWSVATAASLMNAFQTGAFFFTPTTLMPTIVADFNIPLSLSTLPIAIGKVAYVLLLIPGGILVDILGPRLTVLIGISVLALLLTLYATVVQNLPCLILLHILMAAPAAISGVPVYSLFIAQWFTSTNIGLAMGFVLAGYSAAGTLYPAILGHITDNWGWRASMLSVAIALWFVAIPLTYFLLHENYGNAPTRSSRPVREGSNTTNRQSIHASSSHVTIDFQQSPDPKSSTFIGFAFSYILLQYCSGCFVENLMFFLTIDRGLNLFSASLFFSTLNFAAFSAKLIGGYLGDKFDRFYVASAASATAAVGVVFLFIGSPGFDENHLPQLTTNAYTVFIFSILFGFGYGATFNSLYALVPIVFGKKNLGRTQSTFFGVGLVGNAIGSILTSVLRSEYDSYQRPFLIAFVACVANFFVFNATRVTLGGSIEGLKLLNAEDGRLVTSGIYVGTEALDAAEEEARIRIGVDSDGGTEPRKTPLSSIPNLAASGLYSSTEGLTSSPGAIPIRRYAQSTPRTLSFLNDDQEGGGQSIPSPFLRHFQGTANPSGTPGQSYLDAAGSGMVPEGGFPIPRDWSSSSLRRIPANITDFGTPLLPPASSAQTADSRMGVRKSSTLEAMIDSGILSASLESVGYLGTNLNLSGSFSSASNLHEAHSQETGQASATTGTSRRVPSYGATPATADTDGTHEDRHSQRQMASRPQQGEHRPAPSRGSD